MKLSSKTLLGAITLLSSLGMIGMNIYNHKLLDDYIFPFILMCLSVIIFTSKQEKKVKIELSTRKRNVILTLLSLTCIAGMITFIVTLI